MCVCVCSVLFCSVILSNVKFLVSSIYCCGLVEWSELTHNSVFVKATFQDASASPSAFITTFRRLIISMCVYYLVYCHENFPSVLFYKISSITGERSGSSTWWWSILNLKQQQQSSSIISLRHLNLMAIRGNQRRQTTESPAGARYMKSCLPSFSLTSEFASFFHFLGLTRAFLMIVAIIILPSTVISEGNVGKWRFLISSSHQSTSINSSFKNTPRFITI